MFLFLDFLVVTEKIIAYFSSFLAALYICKYVIWKHVKAAEFLALKYLLSVKDIHLEQATNINDAQMH